MTAGIGKARFDIDASVIFQLGQDLVTDDVQALVELVKNAYDADATVVKVIADTEIVGGSDRFPHAQGLVTIEDNGAGMTRDDIIDGWLVISGSRKRDSKADGLTTKRGRTPLGDKGLGRLGAQRLGWNIELFTKSSKEATQLELGFTWHEFANVEKLGDVEISIRRKPASMRNGTRLQISDLRDAAAWSGDDAKSRLQKELSRMISPYEGVENFKLITIIDGIQLDLHRIHDQVRQTSQVRYDIRFDGKTLAIEGRARLSTFRSANSKEQAVFEELVESDGGRAFLSFLKEQPGGEDLRIRREPSKDWFVSFRTTKTLANLPEVIQINGAIANPGPFHASVDSFDLGQGAQQQGVFDRAAEYRKFVKDLSGVHVYRDGFAVRMDRDWLGLGKQWTSATSYYGLKPETSIGFVSLTAKDNAELKEKTDREGFLENPYYLNFERLLHEFSAFSTRAQTFLGRGWVEFRRSYELQDSGADSPLAEDISRQLTQSISRAGDIGKSVAKARTRLATITARRSPSEEDGRVTAELSRLRAISAEVESIMESVAERLQELSSQEGAARALETSIEQFREQLDIAYETMGLGLTAETLYHEIDNIVMSLASNSDRLFRRLRARKDTDEAVLRYVESVRAAANALRRQLSHFGPSLRFVRERRETIELCAFVKMLQSYYQDRWVDDDLTLRLRCIEESWIRMNRGKLTQILDNLVLNSEYWLREEIRSGRQDSGVVSIAVRGSRLTLSDNGRGIEPDVGRSLFEPFVTSKPRGKGRGLGLFVVQQLLDSEGCAISLSTKLNPQGRPFQFLIDFESVMVDEP